MRRNFEALAVTITAALAATLSACNASPAITNTTVTPSSFQVSGIESSANFTVTTDIVDFGSPISSATASIEGQSTTLDLVKQQDIAGGEEWGQTTDLTLWTGFSSGTYLIDITAADSTGTTVVQKDASSVTISN
jgi:hypothetical protein